MLKRGRTPRTRFEELASALGCPPPQVAVETNSIGAQIGIVRQTDLLAWLPEAVVSDHLAAKDIKLLKIPELTQHRQFRAFRRRKGHFPEHAELFLACLTAKVSAALG